MSKKISDARLSTLWSKAVVVKYGRCPVTGEVDDLQAHHIIPKGRQNRFAIRWELRNGVPLSASAHRALHDGDLGVVQKVLDYVRDRGDLDYLMRLKHMLKHEFLSVHVGMTEDEYREAVKRELEGAIHDST